MKLEGVHNFLFHPENQKTTARKGLSIFTSIVLTVFTASSYLMMFGIVRYHDRKKNTSSNITKQPTNNDASTQIFKQAHPTKTTPVPIVKPIATPVNVKKPVESQDLPQLPPRLLHIKQNHAAQLQIFEKWACANNWGNFATAHYDWWMFPINRGSLGQGDTYKVDKDEIELLKEDSEFMRNYQRGVELVLQSWGWDMKNVKRIDEPGPSQKWTGYGVRLGKMAHSLFLFGEKNSYESVKMFYKTVCVPYSDLEGWIKNILKYSFDEHKDLQTF